MDESFASDLNDSRMQSPPRSMSAASDISLNELPPMVYQLPAPLNPTVEYVEHPMSPSSSTSSGSGRATAPGVAPEVTSTINFPMEFQDWDCYAQQN